ncbi:MAG: hypothetical protein H8D65_00685 [Spirochaetes bacterium]|nr:hypothetical protein [Spirochaetota bacterium]
MRRDYQQIPGSLFVSQNTNLLISTLVLLWFLAMIFFAEPYKFWQFAISALGSTLTPNGSPNGISVCLFIGSMAAAFSIMWRLAGFYRFMQTANYKIYAFLYYMGSFGAVVICYPSNVSKPIHSIGGALIVFSHVFITLTHIMAQKKIVPKRRFILRIVMLAVPVLIYAFVWLIWVPAIVQFFQKTAFIALFSVEKLTTNAEHISLEQNLFAHKSDENPIYIYGDT